MTSPTASEQAYAPAAVLSRVRADVVGMERIAEVLAVAVATGRHTVLEGPPGTGKSTLLRSLAAAAGTELRFVEGNAELTPARLVGHFDPAIVLERGYRAEAFEPGPLAVAMQEGYVLYLEELNRIPEETCNVLITALAEGELHVPRFGRVSAHPRFRLIAAMNPFDAIGTARIGQAVYDRLCRIAVGYQDAQHERTIVERVTRAASDGPDVAIGVAMVRGSRSHPDVRVGSSVRGAIDFALLADGLRGLVGPGGLGGLAGSAGTGASQPPAHSDPAEAPRAERPLLLDAACAALSGRLRLDEACDRTPEAVVAELLDAAIEEWEASRRPAGAASEPDGSEDGPGKAPGPARQPPADAGRGRILTGDAARKAVAEAARRTASRTELSARHQAFGRVSPDAGQLDASAVEELAGASPDEAFALLADAANATDPVVRAAARRLAGRLFLRMSRDAGQPRRGMRRLDLDDDPTTGDLDVDASLARADGAHPARRGALLVRRWRADQRSLCLLVDRSGSMQGVAVARAALAAAATVTAAGERGDCSVITFARDAIVLQHQGRPRRPETLLCDILTLRGRGETDLALALRAARRELAGARARHRTAILLSDAKSTAGADPHTALRGLDRLHVLCPSDDPEAVAAATRLARRGGGRCEVVTALADLPGALNRLLDTDR